MEFVFEKMHGLGNDFVVIDAINQKVVLTTAQIRLLADRHLGIGCDQLLMVEKADNSDIDFRYRIFNSDGGEVEQCGNGARCFARFVKDNGLTTKSVIRVETNSGIIELQEENDGQITINMGLPRFLPEQIPFLAEKKQQHYMLEINSSEKQESMDIGAVSMGNPHAVIQVKSLKTAPVTQLGPQIESHPRFPNKTNVGFMQVVDNKTINLRVYERGVGETRACGTGACAAVVIGRNWRLLDERVSVNLPGGELTIRWAGEDQPVYMTGPAETVFEGRISI